MNINGNAALKGLVAFLGPEASYTHQATLEKFSSEHYDTRPQSSIQDIFAAVQDGTTSHGVVPFENSTNGSVVFTLDFFADIQKRFPDIVVDAEMASSHDIFHVKKIYSHPQAWGQCKNFLQTHLKGTERQDVSSTSKGAEIVVSEPASAAISSKMAAQLNGLAVLRENIEDDAGNCTRFLVLRKRSDDTTRQPRAERGRLDYKSLVMFTLNHGEPGALAKCLTAFGKHGINLTSINTRPSGEAPWHYVFFAEFLGRKREASEGGVVNEALTDLERVAKTVRWLGSWEKDVSGQ